LDPKTPCVLPEFPDEFVHVLMVKSLFRKDGLNERKTKIPLQPSRQRQDVVFHFFLLKINKFPEFKQLIRDATKYISPLNNNPINMEMTMGHLTIHNYHNLQKQMDRWK